MLATIGFQVGFQFRLQSITRRLSGGLLLVVPVNFTLNASASLQSVLSAKYVQCSSNKLQEKSGMKMGFNGNQWLLTTNLVPLEQCQLVKGISIGDSPKFGLQSLESKQYGDHMNSFKPRSCSSYRGVLLRERILVWLSKCVLTTNGL